MRREVMFLLLLALAVGSASAQSTSAAPDGYVYKILTDGDGIYRLTARDLLDAGLPLDKIDSRTLRLVLDGIEQPIYLFDRGNNRLDDYPPDQEYLEFFGQHRQAGDLAPGSVLDAAPHTRQVIYRLTWGGAAGRRLVDESGATDPASSEHSLDWIQFAAVDDRIAFTPPAGLGQRYYIFRLRNFTSSRVRLYRIGISRISGASLRLAEALANADSGQPGATYDLMFRVYAADESEEFYATTEENLLSPAIRRDLADEPRKAGTDAAHLAIVNDAGMTAQGPSDESGALGRAAHSELVELSGPADPQQGMVADDTDPPTIRFEVYDQFYTDGVAVPRDARFIVVMADSSGIDLRTIGVTLDGRALDPSTDYSVDDTTTTSATLGVNQHAGAGRHTLCASASDRFGNALEDCSSFELSNDLSLQLYGNYPNPFANETFIAYELRAPSMADEVELKIFSSAGRLVRAFRWPSSTLTLAGGMLGGTGQPNAVGYHEVWWNGLDDRGESVANGVYFYRIRVKTGDESVETIGTLARIR